MGRLLAGLLFDIASIHPLRRKTSGYYLKYERLLPAMGNTVAACQKKAESPSKPVTFQQVKWFSQTCWTVGGVLG
jgi:hypothetical protein